MPGMRLIRVLRFGDVKFRRIETQYGAPGNAGPGVYLQPKSTGLRPNVRLRKMPGPASVGTPNSTLSTAWGLELQGPTLICKMRYIEFHKIETKAGALANAGPGVHFQAKSKGLRPNVGFPKMPGPACLDAPNSTGSKEWGLWVRHRISTK